MSLVGYAESFCVPGSTITDASSERHACEKNERFIPASIAHEAGKRNAERVMRPLRALLVRVEVCGLRVMENLRGEEDQTFPVLVAGVCLVCEQRSLDILTAPLVQGRFHRSLCFGVIKAADVRQHGGPAHLQLDEVADDYSDVVSVEPAESFDDYIFTRFESHTLMLALGLDIADATESLSRKSW